MYPECYEFNEPSGSSNVPSLLTKTKVPKMDARLSPILQCCDCMFLPHWRPLCPSRATVTVGKTLSSQPLLHPNTPNTPPTSPIPHLKQLISLNSLIKALKDRDSKTLSKVPEQLRDLRNNSLAHLLSRLLLKLEVEQDGRAQQKLVELGLAGDDGGNGLVDRGGERGRLLADAQGAEGVEFLGGFRSLGAAVDVGEQGGALADDGDHGQELAVPRVDVVLELERRQVDGVQGGLDGGGVGGDGGGQDGDRGEEGGELHFEGLRGSCWREVKIVE